MALCHVLCLFPLLNMWPLWGQVYFCPVPFFSGKQSPAVLSSSSKAAGPFAQTAVENILPPSGTQKNKLFVMVTENKAAVPLSKCSIQFLQTSGLSPMIQSSAPHLSVSPLSFFSFCFVFLFYVIILYASGSIFSAHAPLLFLGRVHQLLAISPFMKLQEFTL